MAEPDRPAPLRPPLRTSNATTTGPAGTSTSSGWPYASPAAIPDPIPTPERDGDLFGQPQCDVELARE